MHPKYTVPNVQKTDVTITGNAKSTTTQQNIQVKQTGHSKKVSDHRNQTTSAIRNLPTPLPNTQKVNSRTSE